jgi:hypothetical protein
MNGGAGESICEAWLDATAVQSAYASTMDRVSYHGNHIVSDRAHDFVIHGVTEKKTGEKRQK